VYFPLFLPVFFFFFWWKIKALVKLYCSVCVSHSCGITNEDSIIVLDMQPQIGCYKENIFCSLQSASLKKIIPFSSLSHGMECSHVVYHTVFAICTLTQLGHGIT